MKSKARILHEYNNYHPKPNKRKILENCTAVVKNNNNNNNNNKIIIIIIKIQNNNNNNNNNNNKDPTLKSMSVKKLRTGLARLQS